MQRTTDPQLKPISALPAIAGAIDQQYADTVKLVAMLRQAAAATHPPDAAMTMSVEQSCREQVQFLDLCRRQLAAWRKISLHASEATEIDRLQTVITSTTISVEEALRWIAEVRS